MKKIIAGATALAMFALGPALAQQNDRNGDKDDAANRHTEHGSPSTIPERKGRAGQPQPPAAEHHRARTDTAKNTYLPDSGDVRPGPQGGAARGRDDFGRGNTNRNPVVDSRQGDGIHPSNVMARHAERNFLRHNIQASRHFRSGNYIPPRSYQARRWSYGERLPQSYYARSYWIANLGMLDLFSPPPGLVWVRVGNDALLIDQMNGDIVQVRYGVFY